MIYSKFNSGGTRGFRYMVRESDEEGQTKRKMISERSVPANIVELLETQDEVDDTGLKLEAPMKRCVVCGNRSDTIRLVNMQTIELCNDDYYGMTTGQLVKFLKGDVPTDQKAEEVPVT